MIFTPDDNEIAADAGRIPPVPNIKTPSSVLLFSFLQGRAKDRFTSQQNTQSTAIWLTIFAVGESPRTSSAASRQKSCGRSRFNDPAPRCSSQSKGFCLKAFLRRQSHIRKAVVPNTANVTSTEGNPVLGQVLRLQDVEPLSTPWSSSGASIARRFSFAMLMRWIVCRASPYATFSAFASARVLRSAT